MWDAYSCYQPFEIRRNVLESIFVEVRDNTAVPLVTHVKIE